MIWTVPLSFISLSLSLTLAKVHIYRTLLLFSYHPFTSASLSVSTAAHILFSSFRSTYANFWLDII